jgi:hypothetical protein
MMNKQMKELEVYRIGKKNTLLVNQKTHKRTVKKYEDQYGKIEEASAPSNEVGFKG